MAPVHVYSKSPINEAATPAAPPATDAGNNRYVPVPVPPTATDLSMQAAAPPSARPGAVPSLPQPSASPLAPGAGAAGGRYAPSPTTTVNTAAHGPPPPQPGAVPAPPRPGAAAGFPPQTSAPNYFHPQPPPTQAPVLPPPPKAGETLSHQGHAAPAPATMPPQMGMPPLTTSPSYPAAARGTVTAPQAGYASIPQPNGILLPAAATAGQQQQWQQQEPSLDHPPGYVQNAYAADMTSDQRAAAEAAADEGHLHLFGHGAHRSHQYDDGGGEFGTEGIWDAAKKLASAAGERLSAAETEVWRRINKDD